MGFERMFVPELSGLLIIDYGRFCASQWTTQLYPGLCLIRISWRLRSSYPPSIVAFCCRASLKG